MTLPRKSLVSMSNTPFYHCVSRCVRRAFLCGYDNYSEQSYEHRRDWLETKLQDTAGIFAIKLCSYAVMSNHYHVVLHVRPDLCAKWTDREVVERWHKLFNGTPFSQRFATGDLLSSSESKRLGGDIKKWRKRLTSISWFMRVVNEHIARKANKEDQCTGRFWEGRFKSQALLDDAALLSCMSYVDLNPIRAKLANTPEASEYTSIKSRIDALQEGKTNPEYLEDFVGISLDGIGIPFKLKDYIELVDWSGRIIRQDKRGVIENDHPPMLDRLGLSVDNWRILTTEFEIQFHSWVGSEQIVRQVCSDKQYKRPPPTSVHRRLFG